MDNLLALGVTTIFFAFVVWFCSYCIKHTKERRKFSFYYICLYLSILMFLFSSSIFILYLMDNPLLVNEKNNLFTDEAYKISNFEDTVINSKTFSTIHFIVLILTIMIPIVLLFIRLYTTKNKLKKENILGINLIVKIITGILIYWILYGLIMIIL
ncbi:hypothetical protein SAMN05444481_1415 [Flavobacterium frigidimaris]|nr:hypothetical protein SAMN05444481_1415 [Flavobacterium frigidimaris]